MVFWHKCFVISLSSVKYDRCNYRLALQTAYIKDMIYIVEDIYSRKVYVRPSICCLKFTVIAMNMDLPRHIHQM